MNDDLARSFNLRKQMTADMAHELARVSLIIGHAMACMMAVLLPASREILRIIRRKPSVLEKLFNDLRTFIACHAGELPLISQAVDINKLLTTSKPITWSS